MHFSWQLGMKLWGCVQKKKQEKPEQLISLGVTVRHDKMQQRDMKVLLSTRLLFLTSAQKNHSGVLGLPLNMPPFIPIRGKSSCLCLWWYIGQQNVYYFGGDFARLLSETASIWYSKLSCNLSCGQTEVPSLLKILQSWSPSVNLILFC